MSVVWLTPKAVESSICVLCDTARSATETKIALQRTKIKALNVLPHDKGPSVYWITASVFNEDDATDPLVGTVFVVDRGKIKEPTAEPPEKQDISLVLYRPLKNADDCSWTEVGMAFRTGLDQEWKEEEAHAAEFNEEKHDSDNESDTEVDEQPFIHAPNGGTMRAVWWSVRDVLRRFLIRTVFTNLTCETTLPGAIDLIQAAMTTRAWKTVEAVITTVFRMGYLSRYLFFAGRERSKSYTIPHTIQIHAQQPGWSCPHTETFVDDTIFLRPLWSSFVVAEQDWKDNLFLRFRHVLFVIDGKDPSKPRQAFILAARRSWSANNILIHDASRPFMPQIVERLMSGLFDFIALPGSRPTRVGNHPLQPLRGAVDLWNADEKTFAELSRLQSNPAVIKYMAPSYELCSYNFHRFVWQFGHMCPAVVFRVLPLGLIDDAIIVDKTRIDKWITEYFRVDSQSQAVGRGSADNPPAPVHDFALDHASHKDISLHSFASADQRLVPDVEKAASFGYLWIQSIVPPFRKERVPLCFITASQDGSHCEVDMPLIHKRIEDKASLTDGLILSKADDHRFQFPLPSQWKLTFPQNYLSRTLSVQLVQLASQMIADRCALPRTASQTVRDQATTLTSLLRMNYFAAGLRNKLRGRDKRERLKRIIESLRRVSANLTRIQTR